MEELIAGIIGFAVAALTMGISFGAGWLIKSFKDSSNKYDDKLIPLLEKIKAAMDDKETK